MNTEKMKQQLLERLEENNSDFYAGLLSKDRQELIDNAVLIAEHARIYSYLAQEHDYRPEELEYLLKFQNPLEVMETHWLEDSWLDMESMSYVVRENCGNEKDLAHFPLVKDKRPSLEPKRRFLNLDIEESLKQLMGQITVNYRTDLNYTLSALRRGALSQDSGNKNFVVFFRRNGVECMNERDLFIGNNPDKGYGTRSFHTCQFYHTMTNDPVLAYSVEITGMENGRLRGNLYERDNHRLAELSLRSCSPYTSVTVSFHTGREMCFPLAEYDHTSKSDLEYQYGKIVSVRNEPEDESVVQGALHREHVQREKLPKGRFGVHVQKLADKRVQAEAEHILSSFKNGITGKEGEKGTMQEVGVSRDFMELSTSYDQRKLMEKVAYPYTIRNAPQGWGEGKSQIVFAQPVRKKTAEKPSIKEQLFAPALTGNKPQAKSKDREVR